MLRVLKPGGRLVLIEPNKTGVSIVRIDGLVPFIYRSLLRRPKAETFGISFSYDQMLSLVDRAGGRTIRIAGYPLLTFTLLFLIMLAALSKPMTMMVLGIVNRIDEYIRLPHFSYFITWHIENRI